MTKPTILIVDGMNLLHRGFYALEGLKLKDPNHKPNLMNGIVGLVSILLADLRYTEATHCGIVFDAPGGNFRVDLYPEYKAGRESSISFHNGVTNRARKFLKASGFKTFSIMGEEGDDLIGSLATYMSRFGKVYISSNDKDFAALVKNKKIHLLRPQQTEVDEQGVIDMFGVHPSLIVEYLMLVGDKVDNIPGVFNVAGKTASRLLNSHSSIKNILKAKHTPALTKNLKAAKPHFRLTRKLVTIKLDCLSHVSLDDLRIRGLQSRFDEYCQRYRFARTRTNMIDYYRKG